MYTHQSKCCYTNTFMPFKININDIIIMIIKCVSNGGLYAQDIFLIKVFFGLDRPYRHLP